MAGALSLKWLWEFMILTSVFLFTEMIAAHECHRVARPLHIGKVHESKYQQALTLTKSKLGFLPSLVESKPEKIVLIHPDTKDEIGFVTFTYRKNQNEIIIKWIYIENDVYKKKGLSYVIIGRLLQLFPETRTISTAQLARDNLAFLEDQLKNRSLMQALQLTPFYKALAYYGYSGIDPRSITSQFGFAADLVEP